MAAPVLISKIYVLNNSANKGTIAAVTVSGSTTGAAKTGSECQATATNTLTITNASAGTYDAIVTTAGTRSTINRNVSGTTPTIYHITAKSGNDSSMTLTVSETVSTDAVNRTWAIGGPFSTIADGITAAVVGSTIGGYDRVLASNEGGAAESLTAGLTFSKAGNADNGNWECVGYTSSETDDGFYELSYSSGASTQIINITGSSQLIKNISLTGVSGSLKGISTNTGNRITLINCRSYTPAASATGDLIYVNAAQSYLFGCYVDGYNGSSNNAQKGFNVQASNCLLYGCVARRCAQTGFTLAAATGAELAINCIAIDCTGSSGYGYSFAFGNAIGCVADGNSKSGFLLSTSAYQANLVNCISSNNTESGFIRNTSSYNSIMMNNDGYGNATNFSDLQFSDGGVGGGELVNYALDPQFTDRSSKNFAVGENMKAKGIPGSIQGVSTTSYVDIGAAQRQEPASSTISVETNTIIVYPGKDVVSY